MNFEIKSTFKNVSQTLWRWRIPIASAILFINIAALLVMYILYLTNYFLPAVYGSKPNGSRWVLFFELGGLLWLLSTVHTATIMIMNLKPVRRAIDKFDQAVLLFRDTVNDYTRLTTIKFFLVITLLRRVYQFQYAYNTINR